MGKFFNTTGLVNLGMMGWNKVKGVFSASKGGDNLTDVERLSQARIFKNLQGSLSEDQVKALGPGGLEALSRQALQEGEHTVKAAGKVGKFMKWGIGGLAVAGAVDAGVRGRESVLGSAIENAAEGAKKIDALTDTNATFTRWGNFLENLIKFFKNLPEILSGKKDVADIFKEGVPAANTGNDNGSHTPNSSNDPNGPSNGPNGFEASDVIAPVAGAAALGGAGYVGYKGIQALRGRGGSAPGVDAPGIHAVDAADDLGRAAEKAAGVGGHGRGKAALLLGGAVIGGSILSQTFAGSAEAGTPDGATITADNTNAAPTSLLGEAAHKTHVLAHGVQSGLVSLGGSLEDAWDMTDNLMGGWLPGDDKKNSTATFLGNAADSFLISKPEIRGSFDAAVHGAGEVATWLIPVGAAAKGIGAGARTVTALRTMEQAENVTGIASLTQGAANLIFRPN